MSGYSIQAFYKKELPQSQSAEPVHRLQTQHDGFTDAEVKASSNPLGRLWRPSGEHEEVCIAQIQAGPAFICFTGRIVNYAPAVLDSNNTYSRPAHQLIVKDDTGAIAVRLMPIGIPVSRLLIGQLVTIWASWAGVTTNSGQNTIAYVTMYTSVNPADVGTKQFIRFLQDTPATQSLARNPLEHRADQHRTKPLPGLMTLGQYLKTGHDTRGARIVVCVKSIGPRKRVWKHDHTLEVELIEVVVWDDNTSCVMTLWEDKANSAQLWKPNETILLLTSPKFNAPRDSKATPSPASISISYSTLVDVDPAFPDADWLRQRVKSRVKQESICVPFPRDVWDAEEAVNGPVRPLFTLAEVDDFARTDPATDFTGKLNLTILGMDLLDLYRRRMLCCIECCGVPLYANHTSATCKNCMKENPLVLNPRVMGILADETGCIAQGKLVWSEQAWSELFFPAPAVDITASISAPSDSGEVDKSCSSVSAWKQLTTMENSGLRILEEQMMYSRFTLTFG